MSAPIDPRTLSPAEQQISYLAQTAERARVEIERELGRRSFYAFFKMAWKQIDPARLSDNWHIELICRELEAAARREIREMVICIPPRSLKSQIVGVAFPAWVLTWNAAAKFITGSNEGQLATRDSVACRRLITSDWYQSRWGPEGLEAETAAALARGRKPPQQLPVAVRQDQQEKTYWETTAGGHRYTATPGSNVTGHGADYIIVDDPSPAQKAESPAERAKVTTWWFEAIPSRLNEPNRGVKIVIMQRLHNDDLAGECIRRGYYPVVLPAEFEPDHPHRHPRDIRTEPGELLHPARINAQTLARLKKALGPYASAGQLQQRPVPREGGLFQREWFHVVDTVPAECMNSRKRAWDLAATQPAPGKDPDWTVGVRMSRDTLGRFYIEHVVRMQETPLKVRDAMKALATQDGIAVPIGIPLDPGQAGVDQAASTVRDLAGWVVQPKRETGTKDVRAKPFATQVEAGNVFLVRGPWNDAFLDEMGDFPNGSHDDQVDAAVRAFQMFFDAGTGLLDYARAEAAAIEEPLRPENLIVERHVLGWPGS